MNNEIEKLIQESDNKLYTYWYENVFHFDMFGWKGEYWKDGSLKLEYIRTIQFSDKEYFDICKDSSIIALRNVFNRFFKPLDNKGYKDIFIKNLDDFQTFQNEYDICEIECKFNFLLERLNKYHEY